MLEREISPQLEEQLWASFRLEPDSEDLRGRLLELYLPLIARVVCKMPLHIRQKISSEELVSSGVIGLNEAITSFSDDKNVLFSTYAFKRIKGAMLDELRSQDHLTRTQRNCYKEICAAIHQLTAELARPPSDNEIAARVKMSEEEVNRYIGMGSEMVNLNDEFGDGLTYMDTLADNKSMNPFDSADQTLSIEKLRNHFRSLDEREQKILFLRYFEDMSVKEIAKVMEISEGRISQIYHKVVLKLRALMNIDQEL